ncbi:MAG: sterol desaturase family protein [Alphaproteobacteria bacterium]|nr:sterol desaturase family protein [Alphaproteobacteria bacterium]
MDWLTNLVSLLLFPLYYLTQPDSQYYWPTYVASGVAAVVLYMVVRRRWHLSFHAIKELLLPTKLLEHKSSKLDAKMFFAGLYYLALQVLLVGGTTVLTVSGTVAAMTRLFGPGPAPIGPSWIVTGLTMFLVFMAVEFGYWLAHFAMHKVPALWEFHKVHHSAEVLTPLTEWRQHPVELALFPILMSGAACLVQGPMVWAFGASAQVIDPMKANLLSMAFWYSILHLRHSQLPITATGWLGRIIQTPAHHQAHHSTDQRHYDTNMGYCLAFWDWVFGTLYVPRKGETFAFGLGHEDSALETVWGSILAPIGRFAVIVLKGLGIELKPAGKSREV